MMREEETMTFEDMKTAAAELSPDEQAELLEVLHDCLSKNDQIKAEWLAIARKRLDEMRNGKVIVVPADQVLKNLLV